MPKGGFASLLAYKQFIYSERHLLPFSGGFLEQPQWVIDDFTLFDNVMDLVLLNAELPDVSHLPKI